MFVLSKVPCLEDCVKVPRMFICVLLRGLVPRIWLPLVPSYVTLIGWKFNGLTSPEGTLFCMFSWLVITLTVVSFSLPQARDANEPFVVIRACRPPLVAENRLWLYEVFFAVVVGCETKLMLLMMMGLFTVT